MDIDGKEHVSERAELHFLAALIDELMKTLHAYRIMLGSSCPPDRTEPRGARLTRASREQLQEVEDAVCARIGTEPRAW